MATRVRASRPHHDYQGHVGRPQSFQGFGAVCGTPVVEDGPGDVEPARRVDGQLPVDEVLVAFALQHWDVEERKRQRG